jgi:hypothetical protein
VGDKALREIAAIHKHERLGDGPISWQEIS